jgi:hypothetical protein
MLKPVETEADREEYMSRAYRIMGLLAVLQSLKKAAQLAFSPENLTTTDVAAHLLLKMFRPVLTSCLWLVSSM